MIVGERLKEFRVAKGLSQGDIEARSGLIRCYVSRVENGHTIPALGTLEKWTNALKIPLYQLFYDGPSNVAPIEESDFPRDKNALQLRKFGLALKKMSNRDRQILFGVAQQMAVNKPRKR
jgi:transcriptional regulator with XRE-family HTH domain